MEDISSFWSYQENIDGLKEKLLYTTLELESARAEVRKNKENMDQLLQLLETACQERDEARNRLQNLLNKDKPISSPSPNQFTTNIPPQVAADIPLIKPTKANSSITESNSPSETHNIHSHPSSPFDSFFDPVSSPDSSKTAFLDHPFVQTCNGTVSTDPVLDNLVKGKILPQKGKLLQAVMEAGPLLQSLLVAGPLPKWRNPPPHQHFHIPPFSIKGSDAEIVTGKTDTNSSHVLRPMNPQSYVDMSCGSSLNFRNGPSGSCAGKGRLISAGVSTNSYVPNPKRQRLL